MYKLSGKQYNKLKIIMKVEGYLNLLMLAVAQKLLYTCSRVRIPVLTASNSNSNYMMLAVSKDVKEKLLFLLVNLLFSIETYT